MIREKDSVSVSITNAVGSITFVGTGSVKRVKKEGVSTAYEVVCDDGKVREVSKNNPDYKNDTIMVL